MKRWKVIETHYALVSFLLLRSGYRGEVTPPLIVERLYRWRWMARLAAFNVNSFYAFNPFLGAGWARVEKVG